MVCAGVSVRVMLQQCFRYSTPGGGGGEAVALDMASEAHPERAMQVRARRATLRARWVTTLRARWVTTLRARWVTLRVAG